MSYDNYISVVLFYLSLLKNFHVFFYLRTDVNNCVQKILWYNNAWVVHKREGQNYFNKIDDLTLPHPILVLKIAKRNVLEMFYFNTSFLDFSLFLKVLSHFSRDMISNQKN